MNDERQLREIKVELFWLGAKSFLVPRNATDEYISKVIRGHLLDAGVKWRFTNECYIDGGEAWRYNIQIGDVNMKVVDD